MPDEQRLLTVGVIAKAHGLRGEVIVRLVTDQLERLDPGSVLACGSRTLTVTMAKPHQDRWRVAFAELSDRTAAEAVHGMELKAAPLERDDVLWIHELIGATVASLGGASLGTVVAVEANPASDLLVLEGGALIPLRFVVSQSEAKDSIIVDVPNGLLEI